MRNKDDAMRWIPLWCDKWLFGSTRLELQPDERAVFIDLLVLASKDSGYIRANETTEYNLSQLAGLLCISEELLERSLRRCIETGKLRKSENGIGYYIVNWAEYQLSERHKRRFFESRIQMSPNSDITTAKTDTMSQKAVLIGDYNGDNKRKGDPPTGVSLTPEEFVSLYNLHCPNLLKASSRISQERRSKIRARLKECDDRAWWIEVFSKANESYIEPHEGHPRGWRPDLSFIIKNGENPIKILEGKYIPQSRRTHRQQAAQSLLKKLERIDHEEERPRIVHNGTREVG